MSIKIKLASAIILLCANFILAQEADIVPYLKQIENGEKEQAELSLLQLEKKSPDDPAVRFLRAVLTENGQDAVDMYTYIVKKHPRSKYADAALYRLYAYYYALGLYQTAKGYYTRLDRDYPQSPYLKLATNNLPAEDEPSTQVPVQEKVNNEVPPDQFRFSIQAGAFTSAANASALKKDFEKSGYDTEIKEKNVGGTVFQVVYVGKFHTEDEAKSFLQVINSEFNLQGRVISLN